MPPDWAQTQMNLGNALESLGERLKQKDILAEALQAVHNAQAVYVEVGLRQHDDYLAVHTKELEDALATMGSG